MRFRSCALAGALLTAIAVQADSPRSPDAPQANAEAEVRALEQRWVDAELRRDAAAVAELLDEQFLVVFGAGKPIDTATYIKRQGRWRALAEHMVMEEPLHQ